MTDYSKKSVLKYLTGKPDVKTFLQVLAKNYVIVPEKAGIYAWYFINKSKTLDIMYIGEAGDLRERIKTHCTSFKNSPIRQGIRKQLRETDFLSEGTRINMEKKWMSNNALICWVELGNRKEVEEYLIKEIKPLFNIEHNPQNRG